MDLFGATSILSPVLGLAVAVTAHVLISRSEPAFLRHRVIAVSMTGGLLVVAGLGIAFAARGTSVADPVERGIAAGSALLAYLCFAYSYVFGFFNPSETARRVRIVVELLAAGDRGLRLDELYAVYNARMAIDVRVDRLVAGGQLVERDGRYVIGAPAMLYLARLFVLLKIVFYGVPTEFARPQPAQSDGRLD